MTERGRTGMDKERSTVDQGSLAPSAGPAATDGSEKAPLSPSERARRAQEHGHSGAQMGMENLADPADPQKRVSHEVPGTDAANPLPQALDPNPTPRDDR